MRFLPTPSIYQPSQSTLCAVWSHVTTRRSFFYLIMGNLLKNVFSQHHSTGGPPGLLHAICNSAYFCAIKSEAQCQNFFTEETDLLNRLLLTGWSTVWKLEQLYTITLMNVTVGLFSNTPMVDFLSDIQSDTQYKLNRPKGGWSPRWRQHLIWNCATVSLMQTHIYTDHSCVLF